MTPPESDAVAALREAAEDAHALTVRGFDARQSTCSGPFETCPSPYCSKYRAALVNPSPDLSGLRAEERFAAEQILNRPSADPDDDAAIVARAALRLDRSGTDEGLDVERLARAAERVALSLRSSMTGPGALTWTAEGATSADLPLDRLAAEYRRLSGAAPTVLPLEPREGDV